MSTADAVTIPERIRVPNLQPDAFRHALALAGSLRRAGLEQSLYDLIDVRVSQINGCAYCLHMHTTEAREHGETDVRLHQLGGWAESSLFTARERAALGLAEAITDLREGHVPDTVWEEASRHFSEPELAAVVLASSMINFWNRVEISTRARPGGR